MIKREQSLTLPAVFLLIRETHRCWRNSMTSNIDRRRIWSFSYSVLTWLMRWAADWNIVSEVIELWQVFVNGMMPTFWAVTFFMRWKIHEKFRVPANQRKNAFDLFTISNRKSLHNINEDWKSRYKRIGKFLCGKIYITSDADNVLIKSTIWTYHSLSFIRSFAMCGWNLLQSRVYVTNPTVLFPISHRNLNSNHILFIPIQAASIAPNPNAQQNQLEIPTKASESISIWFLISSKI